VDRAALEYQAISRIFWMARAVRTATDQVLAPFGVTAQQWLILRCCCDGGESTPSELAERVRLDCAAVSRLLDRLEAKHLVVRRPNPAHRRSVLVAPTEAGRALEPQLTAAANRSHSRFFGEFSRDEITHLTGMLDRALAR
jgi:DNA-binding MarR family transcriptional regulator